MSLTPEQAKQLESLEGFREFCAQEDTKPINKALSKTRTLVAKLPAGDRLAMAVDLILDVADDYNIEPDTFQDELETLLYQSFSAVDISTWLSQKQGPE